MPRPCALRHWRSSEIGVRLPEDPCQEITYGSEGRRLTQMRATGHALPLQLQIAFNFA